MHCVGQFVNVQRITHQIHNHNRDIGAVITHALEIGDQVIKHIALADRTFSFLQPGRMPLPHLQADPVDHLFQRFHPAGGIRVVIQEA